MVKSKPRDSSNFTRPQPIPVLLHFYALGITIYSGTVLKGSGSGILFYWTAHRHLEVALENSTIRRLEDQAGSHLRVL